MKLSRLALAALFMGGIAPRAEAIALNTPTTICWTLLSVSACASVTVEVSGSTLTATVENLNSAPTTNPWLLEAFGFFTYSATSSSLTLSPSPQYADVGDQWQYVDGSPNIGGGGPDYGDGKWLGGAKIAPTGDPVPPGSTGVFTFSISGTLPTGDLWFAFAGNPAPEGERFQSFKCWEGNRALPQPNTAECGYTEVVPEPATMALLATGLVGLGGAGLIRRRKNG